MHAMCELLVNDLLDELSAENRRLLSELQFVSKLCQMLDQMRDKCKVLAQNCKCHTNRQLIHELLVIENDVQCIEQAHISPIGVNGHEVNATIVKDRLSVDRQPVVDSRRSVATNSSSRVGPKAIVSHETYLMDKRTGHMMDRNVTQVTVVHKSTGVECHECGQLFMTTDQLDRHMSDTHAMSVSFECLECEQVFMTQDLLRRHMNAEHMKTTKSMANEELVDHLLCRKCGQLFDTTSELAIHMKCAHILKKYVCRECKQQLNTDNELISHWAQYHVIPTEKLKTRKDHLKSSDPKLITEILIQKSQNISNLLTINETTVSEPLKPLSTTSSPASLLSTTSSAKPFKCGLNGCGERFQSVTTLFAHKMAEHNGQPGPNATDTSTSILDHKYHTYTHCHRKRSKKIRPKPLFADNISATQQSIAVSSGVEIPPQEVPKAEPSKSSGSKRWHSGVTELKPKSILKQVPKPSASRASEVHNRTERQRRAHLRQSFGLLRNELPKECHKKDDKSPNIRTLCRAIACIESLNGDHQRLHLLPKECHKKDDKSPNIRTLCRAIACIESLNGDHQRLQKYLKTERHKNEFLLKRLASCVKSEPAGQSLVLSHSMVITNGFRSI
ncbi:unnamed protein product [Oppiella nova]|uniref:Uncharacterized protein n=1 Tax=Oppiella nova TaxID=334625 RepID=A0A7R9M8A8_9ACAR|nr:unnamed protein product [Oppiella nova]CAG2172666.1 unnamed protein product [Oppiella nova]